MKISDEWTGIIDYCLFEACYKGIIPGWRFFAAASQAGKLRKRFNHKGYLSALYMVRSENMDIKGYFFSFFKKLVFVT